MEAWRGDKVISSTPFVFQNARLAQALKCPLHPFTVSLRCDGVGFDKNLSNGFRNGKAACMLRNFEKELISGNVGGRHVALPLKECENPVRKFRCVFGQ